MFGLLVSAAAAPPPAALPDCQTPTCIEAAKTITDYVDFNVNPCDNFFQYSCVGTLDNIADENFNALRDVYEGDYYDLINNIPWDMSAFNTADLDQAQMDRQNFEKVQSYYKQCMDTNAIDAQGPTPVYPQLAKLQAAIPNQLDLESLTDARVEMLRQAVVNFFDNGIYPDDKQPDVYAISVSQPKLTLPKGFYKDPEPLQIYHQAIVDLLQVTLGNDNTDTLQELRSQKAAENKLKLLSPEERNAMADGVIEVEKFLASISLEEADLMDPVALYNPVPVGELQTKYPFINWERFLRAMVEEGTPLPEYIIVNTPTFFDSLTYWLAPFGVSDTKYPSLQAFKDFMFFKTLIRWNYALDTASRNAWKPVGIKMLKGTTEFYPRHMLCINYADDALGMIQGRYFVMKKFGGKQERAKLSATIDIIRETLLNLLAGSSWLDKPTLQVAIDKANKIEARVAYNILSPDERLPEALQKYYNTLIVSENSYMETELSYVDWRINLGRQKIGHPVDKDHWSSTPLTVNAYYDQVLNQITILAGIAQAPVYYSDAPDYLKYGALGFLVGHELTHAFDSAGRQYNADGKLENWWSPETAKHFNEMAQCITDQYGNFTFKGPDGKDTHLDGKLSLTENIADNGGFAITYQAFQQVWNNGPLANEHPSKQEKLPGIDLTPEQLFFVNYGVLWCGVLQPEYAAVLVTTDPHSIEEFRITGVVQNSPDFAKAFQCPVGSPMNPKKKCTVW
ncbi:hypothetical protein BDA99DRAFT_488321 [Phascolomyces articulosus]|uniref:Uncharacterized protein n=1 Tax=Phascolomyces articulosus TaxID=60185 RepID=A0AAD5K0L7_9FUNG|nr:hypothetical protein BDA99DRAFT_488321 [Phascolomyces articulosus]